MDAKFNSYFLISTLLLCLSSCGNPNHHKLIPFEKDGKWGYMDEKYKVVIVPQYIIANDFSPEGIAAVVDDSSWAYINKAGDILIRPFIFDNGPDYFQEDLARFKAGNRFGFFDKWGKIVISARFDFVFPYYEKLAAFCSGCSTSSMGEHQAIVGGEWGFIDKTGKVVIQPRFYAARSFSGGVAAVQLDDKQWGFINQKGEFMAKTPK